MCVGAFYIPRDYEFGLGILLICTICLIEWIVRTISFIELSRSRFDEGWLIGFVLTF